MTDNGDGTYTYNYSVQNDGAIAVVVKLSKITGVDSLWYGSTDFTNLVLANTTSQIGFQNDGSADWFPGYRYDFTAILSGKITAPTTDTYTFQFFNDDGSKIIFDGVELYNHYPEPSVNRDYFDVSMVKNSCHDFTIYYYQHWGWYTWILYWKTSTMAEQIIPASAYGTIDIVRSSPFQNTVSWPTGYSSGQSSYPDVCHEICGDGLRIGTEQWDDGNLINGDGWQIDWSVTPNFICSGGSIYVKDTCVEWTTGFTPNIARSQCIPVWGDGRRVGTESWDDANTSNGDGWSSTCTIEAGYSWTGGSLTSIDICVLWSAGYYQDLSNPTTWITRWGDGFRAGSEVWDDGNTSSGDGCLSNCSSIETGCIWTGGSPTSKDICTLWSSGFSPNSSKSACVTIWGDGFRAGSEVWDDGNTSNGDGCLNDWSFIETGYIWTGGSSTSKDTCSIWSSGFSPNLSKSACVAVWGDGLRVGSEVWDDGNTSSGDGCSNDCLLIESGYVWTGGSLTSKDTCTLWSSGYSPNSSKSACVTVWGDGFRAGSEVWDDGNTSSGDGCLSDWSSIQSGYIWTGGSTSSKDICTLWSSGFSPNLSKSVCVTTWGDGFRAGTEVCDDANTSNGDGCSSDCLLIESECVCNGGSLTSKDIWTIWSSGFSPNLSKTVCVTTWGDGFRAGTEVCDDANTSSGDGCSSDCSSIETGYSCSGGSPTSKDICTKWNKGLYQNASNPSKWIPKWGDGIRASYEAWDDGNALSGDGWSSDCLKIESGWVWFGGFVGITDVWVVWDLGYDQNPDYSKCIGAEVPRDAKGMAAAAQITAIMGISTNLIVTVFSSSSSSSSNSFGMLNQIQLVILLPLIGAYIPQKIYDYLKSMNTSLFNMNFLPTSNSESTISLKSVFDFKQPNSYLYLLQLNSGSSLVNILDLTTTVGFVIAAHILLLIIYVILRKINKYVQLQNFTLKLLGMMTFGFYLGVCLESFILFLLVNISEIHYQIKNGTSNFKSTVASYIILSFILSFMLLTLWQWWKSRKPEVLETMKYFVFLVDGMKKSWIWRSYWFVFLVRRMIFIWMIFFMEEFQMMVNIIWFASVQALYFAYIVILRPQDSVKENVSDFINEVFFLYFVMFLLYFNTDSRWDDTTTEIYFWILMSNNFILIFIMLGKLK